MKINTNPEDLSTVGLVLDRHSELSTVLSGIEHVSSWSVEFPNDIENICVRKQVIDAKHKPIGPDPETGEFGFVRSDSPRLEINESNFEVVYQALENIIAARGIRGMFYRAIGKKRVAKKIIEQM